MDWDKLNKVFEEMCVSFGIDVKDSNGNYRGFNDVISDLSEAWNKKQEN